MRRQRPGRTALPRLRIHAAFPVAVRDSKLPYEPLALACGCRVEHFSVLINSVAVPATARNISVLLRAADAIRFPRDRVFLDEVPTLDAAPVVAPLTDADRAADRLKRARERVAQLEQELRQAQASNESELVQR
jgi:hypothetical protein